MWVKGKVEIAQSCLTLCDPMDYTVHGILQARILECISFSGGSGNHFAFLYFFFLAMVLITASYTMS